MTVAFTHDEDDLFESCLSTNSVWSLDNDCHRDVDDLGDLRHSVSLQSSNYKKAVITATTDRSCCPREPSRKNNIFMLNRNGSEHFMADVTNTSEPDSLLNKTFSSLNISSDGSIGQSWLSSDLTTITALSDSSCSLHFVRIERQPVVDDGDDNKQCSLVEAVLIPTNHADANTSCQRGNLECSYLSDDRTFLADWKTAAETGDEDAEVKVMVPASVKAMSAAELRARLNEFGESPGPIVESTRRLHDLRLSRLIAGCDGHRTTAGNGLNTG